MRSVLFYKFMKLTEGKVHKLEKEKNSTYSLPVQTKHAINYFVIDFIIMALFTDFFKYPGKHMREKDEFKVNCFACHLPDN